MTFRENLLTGRNPGQPQRHPKQTMDRFPCSGRIARKVIVKDATRPPKLPRDEALTETKENEAAGC